MTKDVYQKRFEAVKQKAVKNREREVQPVACDSNKTKRKMVRPTKKKDAP